MRFAIWLVLYSSKPQPNSKFPLGKQVLTFCIIAIFEPALLELLIFTRCLNEFVTGMSELGEL